MNNLMLLVNDGGVQLGHGYTIVPANDGYNLMCGGSFVFWDQHLDRVLSRYCMQVVSDCGLTHMPVTCRNGMTAYD